MPMTSRRSPFIKDLFCTSAASCAIGAAPPSGGAVAPSRSLAQHALDRLPAVAEGDFPTPAQPRRRDDEADHRVALWKIAPERAGLGCNVLGEKPDMVAAGED